jgi:hypothetical protein
VSQASTALSDDERKGNKPKRRSPVTIPASEDLDALLSVPQIRPLLGGVTKVTITRWFKQGKLPQPDAVIGSRYFWQRRTILKVLAEMKANVPVALAAAQHKQDMTKAGIPKKQGA